MKRNLFIIVGVFLAVLTVIFAGNVITIGDKMSEAIHPYAEYAFYVVLLVLFVVFIIGPIIRVHRTPQFPKLSVDDQISTPELIAFGKKLTKNCYYIHNEQQRQAHSRELARMLAMYANNREELESIVRNEVNLRLHGDKKQDIMGINARIKEWAKTVFMVTAISQNSKFDTLSVLFFNYKMIEEIILASGFRPTNKQLFNQYVRILTTSLITYVSSEVLQDMDDIAPFESLGDGEVAVDGATEWTMVGTLKKLSISGLIAGSVVDGVINALMTLRIGYVTRAYLINGSDALTGYTKRRKVKRQAMIDAFKAVPSVVLSSSAVLSKGALKVLKGLWGFGDEEKEEKNGQKTS